MGLLRSYGRWFAAGLARPAGRATPAAALDRRPEPARRSRRALARRDVFWWLLGLVALQAPLAVWVEQRHPELRDPEFGQKIQLLQARLAEEPARPLFLALGSSRTLNGFRPGRLSNMAPPGHPEPLYFNFGLTAHSPLHQLACFNRLLNAGVRPRWLLVEVTPSFLPIQTAASKMVSAGAQEWSDLPVLRPYEPFPPCLYASWLEARVMPWFSHRFALVHRYLPRWLPTTYTQYDVLGRMTDGGWLPLPKPASKEEYDKKLKDAERDHRPVLESFAISKVAAGSLRELLGRCRDLGIRTALVLTPEGSRFRGWYGPDTDRQIRAFLSQLVAEFGLPVTDARDWVADDCFWDGHHLLPEGAALYTERLGRELIGPMVGK